MRSSIACIRCRRSKVKCVNNGVGTTCRACENSGRDCQYPSPVTTGTRRRDSISARLDGPPPAAGDVERRQRPRKSNHAFATTSARDSPRPRLDAIDPTLLTSTVWQELFDIFQIHYSADLPFLHSPTFLKPLRMSGAQRPPSATPNFNADAKPAIPSARPPASTEFLLAFLALTSRFHPKIVAHHSPSTSSRPSNPRIASEYYAAAANERLTTLWMDNRKHDIEFTQACLMLGLHEWGTCRGAKAWLLVGIAIRSAQAMGLQYELDLDDEPLSRSVALNAESDQLDLDSRPKSATNLSKSPGDAFIQQEIRRRTFWSCYIMDRYLSSGKYRPQMLQTKELRIQLPASESSFMFAEKVRTLMLGEDDKTRHVNGRVEVQNQRQLSVLLATGSTPEPNMAPSPRSLVPLDNDEDKGKLETGKDEGLVSRYIKVLEIYGKVVKWSCSGGRRVEEHPPWDPRCTFYQLNQQCHDFKANLPRQHTLSPINTQAHISMKTATPYTLVHTVYLLCQIMLHREYVPFIPIRCKEPSGPLDPPLFTSDRYDTPPGFWGESARECFRSAREIIDLVLTCQEWNTLVETPIVGFAVYTVSFVGVYCINFNWMDPDGFMCTPPSPRRNPSDHPSGRSEGFLAARKALEVVGNMRTKLHMADGWFNTITRMHKYFRKMKIDYRRNVHSSDSSGGEALDSPDSARLLSLRDGGAGGGLAEYKEIERTLIDFGNLEDQDIEMVDAEHPPDFRPLDTSLDESSAEISVKSEDPDQRSQLPHPPQPENSGSWSAINTVSSGSAGRPPATSPPTSGQFRSYEPYPPITQPQQQQQEAPTPQSQTYSHQMHGFRAAYPQNTPSTAGAPPSLTSPNSHATNTPAQHSPSLERSQGYSPWTPQNPTYPLQPGSQHQTPYNNSISQNHNAANPAPQSSVSNAGYPAHSGPTQHHRTAPPLRSPVQIIQPVSAPNATWSALGRDDWLRSIDTRLGGDDIAAFVDGGDLNEWATMAQAQGFSGGWLNTLWTLSSSNESGADYENGNSHGNGTRNGHGHGNTIGHGNGSDRRHGHTSGDGAGLVNDHAPDSEYYRSRTHHSQSHGHGGGSGQAR